MDNDIFLKVTNDADIFCRDSYLTGNKFFLLCISFIATYIGKKNMRAHAGHWRSPYRLCLQLRLDLFKLLTSQTVFSLVKPGPVDITLQPAAVLPEPVSQA